MRQYMRSSTCGVFLLVNNSEKRWQEAETRRLLDFDELLVSLGRKADALAQKYPNVSCLSVIGIDLTAR